MSLHLVAGPPGGGKSYFAFRRLLVDELLLGDRWIVTNLAVKLPELNEQLQRCYPARNINLHDRLRVISDEDVHEFFRIRPGWTVTVAPDKHSRIPIAWQPDADTPADKVRGVMYILDEVHLFFNARNWMNNGREIGFYLSQHRKLGDDIIAISQAPEKLDKQFRLDAQDSTVVRNIGKENWGVFRLPEGRIVASTFFGLKGAGNKPNHSFTFKIEKDWANCYDTAKGVGVTGRSADKGERRRGVPWQLVILLFLSLLVLVWFAPGWTKKVVSRATKGIAGNVRELSPASVHERSGVNSSQPPPGKASAPSVALSAPSNVTVKGWFTLGNATTLFMSDGSTISRGVQAITERGVLVDGRFFELTRPVSQSATVDTNGAPMAQPVYAAPASAEPNMQPVEAVIFSPSYVLPWRGPNPSWLTHPVRW